MQLLVTPDPDGASWSFLTPHHFPTLFLSISLCLSLLAPISFVEQKMLTWSLRDGRVGGSRGVVGRVPEVCSSG